MWNNMRPSNCNKSLLLFPHKRQAQISSRPELAARHSCRHGKKLEANPLVLLKARGKGLAAADLVGVLVIVRDIAFCNVAIALFDLLLHLRFLLAAAPLKNQRGQKYGCRRGGEDECDEFHRWIERELSRRS